MLLYHYLSKQDPESPTGKLNAQDPLLYDSGIWIGCKEIVEKLKKECDSQHADLNP